MSNLSIGRFQRHASSFNLPSSMASPTAHLGQLLDVEIVESSVQALGIQFRERIFDPAVTLWTWLSQVLSDKPSCRKAVEQLHIHRLAKGLPAISTLTGSFTKAKARLPAKFFEDVALAISAKAEQLTEKKWLWRGKTVVKVVDGTSISMLDTLENAKAFPKYRHQKCGVGFPQARLLGVFSLSTGGLLRMAFGAVKGKGTGELTLLHQLWESFSRGETLMGDCMFSSFAVIAAATQRGVDIVAEYRPSSGKRLRSQKLDQIVKLIKPAHRPEYLSDTDFSVMASQIAVRIIKVQVACRGFRPKTKYILTTHIAKNVKADDIAELYRQRWNVELNFGALKTSLGMNFIRAQSPAMVTKEIWMHLLGYNLLRSVMATAAHFYDRLPNQISFRATQHAFSAVRFVAGLIENSGQLIDAVLRALVAHRVGNRPGRYEPRVIKRQNGSYRTMIVPRKVARAHFWKRAK